MLENPEDMKLLKRVRARGRGVQLGKATSCSAFRALLRESNLPEPVVEYQVDPERRWRFDYAWPLQCVALEVEGGVWTGGRHIRGSGYLHDMEKYNRAALDGWLVLRCTPDTLTKRDTLAMLSKAINTRGCW